jgi:hypothetical protein
MPTQQTVIPFAPASTSVNADQLDRAGQTILQLLNKAAGVAEENSRNAIEVAQGFSHQLHAAEDRIAELEAQAAAYQEQAERAEQWLHRVYKEIRGPLFASRPKRASGRTATTIKRRWTLTNSDSRQRSRRFEMRPANCRGPIYVAVTCDVARVRLGKGPWRVEYWRAVRTPGEAADESWRQRRVRQGHPAGYPRRRRPAKSPIINSNPRGRLQHNPSTYI